MQRRGSAAVRAANGQRRPQPATGGDGDHRRLRPRDRAGRHFDFPGAALRQRARRGRSAVARQQPQSGDHRRRTHRRSARGQRGDPALRLYRQPRPALAAGQHHGLHQRTRGIARRHLPADRIPCPRRICRAASARQCHRYRRARPRRRRQAALAGFHRSARLHQIVDRQDGPPDHGDPQPHPRGPARVPAGADRYPRTDRDHR